MGKAFKNMAVFSLWLAGLVIIAHLLIPHDHHCESNIFTKDDACHADNAGHPHKSPVFPLHCHALNDLTFEKTSPVFVVDNNVLNCDLFVQSFIDSNITPYYSSVFKIRDYQIPLIDIDFLRLSHFRAPPSLV